MTYTNSLLVNYTRISPNRSTPRGSSIDTITIHCVVGQLSVQTLGSVFANSSAQASSNYGVGYDGKIGMYVEEKDRSWCTSSKANDNRAVTIEVACDPSPPFRVNDVAYEALIKLVADICKRNKIKKLLWKGDKSLIGQVDKQNMTAHRWFANKACPGDYLYNKFGDVATAVNKILDAGTADTGTSKPTTTKPTTNKKVILKYSVGEVVQYLGGKHYVSPIAKKGAKVGACLAKVTAVSGSGKHPYHVRKINAAGKFISNGVYGWVNESRLSARAASATEITYTVVSGDSLSLIATRYGTTYQKLMEYNRIANPNKISIGQQIKIPTAAAVSAKKTNEEIAKEIVTGQGNWGTGETRKQRLAAAGYNYNEIQKVVNKLLEK